MIIIETAVEQKEIYAKLAIRLFEINKKPRADKVLHYLLDILKTS